MKIAIVGAGGIGTWLGLRLAKQHEVSVLARAATLTAIKQGHWTLSFADGTPALNQAVAASDDAHQLGAQDLVLIAVKGQHLNALAPSLLPLIAPHTLILPAMNGVPWWFTQGFVECATQQVPLPYEQVLGCVVHASIQNIGPGHATHKMGNGLIIGEPKGGHSARAAAVVAALSEAGFTTTHSDNIRYDIWYKLWGNLTMNPLSAVTGATVDKILLDPLLRALCTSAMREAAAVGARLGCPITQTPEDRHQVTAKLGAFKTSMLQDVEAGRSIELDVIVTAVHDIAVRLSIPTPSIDAILGITRVFAQTRGLY
ncbi:MAG: hypothetical protein RLZZ502_663 [Pseudomonadota bacterium]|jgi:2-dehydropantoate 2-reductase